MRARNRARYRGDDHLCVNTHAHLLLLPTHGRLVIRALLLRYDAGEEELAGERELFLRRASSSSGAREHRPELDGPSGQALPQLPPEPTVSLPPKPQTDSLSCLSRLASHTSVRAQRRSPLWLSPTGVPFRIGRPSVQGAPPHSDPVPGRTGVQKSVQTADCKIKVDLQMRRGEYAVAHAAVCQIQHWTPDPERCLMLLEDTTRPPVVVVVVPCVHCEPRGGGRGVCVNKTSNLSIHMLPGATPGSRRYGDFIHQGPSQPPASPTRRLSGKKDPEKRKILKIAYTLRNPPRTKFHHRPA